jgi:hypothetical protein
MPIWKLVPIDPDDPNWEASSHRELVIVRASHEASARKAAEDAFAVKTRFAAGKGLRVPPWTRSDLVRAEIIESPIYADEGPTEILEPSFKEGS